MTIEELTPEQIAETLNKFGWREHDNWQPTMNKNAVWVSDRAAVNIQDARAIASYLLLTQPGSFFWALERMKEGRKVRRRIFHDADSVYIERGDVRWTCDAIDYRGPKSFHLADLNATDWQLVVETGEKE